MHMILSVLAAIVTTALFTAIYQKKTNAVCRSKRRLDGRTAIVTGGTAGMGLHIAIDFAKRGARVIIACPFPKEGEDALKTIIEESGNKNVHFKLLDLSSLQSVRRFASDILKNESRLDILMNNAGTAAKGECITKDGMNYIMQVNYFGQFLLTILLLPLLLKTGSPTEASRIVNTGSLAHHVGSTDVRKYNAVAKVLHILRVYANSKIALLSFNFELARKLSGNNVVVNGVDPGAVGTDIFYGVGLFAGIVMKYLCRSMYKTAWEGAQTAIHVAVDEETGKISGGYFSNCRQTTANRRAYKQEPAKLLWEESARLVGLTEGEINQRLKGVLL